MKVPKTFVSERNLDKTIEKLIAKKPVIKPYNEFTVNTLLKDCNKFLEKQICQSDLERIYNIGNDLIKHTSFTKNDLKELVQRITPQQQDYHQSEYSGFYISALVNKIMSVDNKPIKLKLDSKLFGLGAYLKKGVLILDGDIGYFLGHCMKGGKIIVKGDVEDNIGSCMLGGKIIVHGDIRGDIGTFMQGGDILAYGNIGIISISCNGRIYQWGKQVWPK